MLLPDWSLFMEVCRIHLKFIFKCCIILIYAISLQRYYIYHLDIFFLSRFSVFRRNVHKHWCSTHLFLGKNLSDEAQTIGMICQGCWLNMLCCPSFAHLCVPSRGLQYQRDRFRGRHAWQAKICCCTETCRSPDTGCCTSRHRSNSSCCCCSCSRYVALKFPFMSYSMLCGCSRNIYPLFDSISTRLFCLIYPYSSIHLFCCPL